MVKRVSKFFITGLSGTAVDTVVLWLLTETTFHSYTAGYLIAPVISFETAMLNNYLISYMWIWSDRVSRTTADFFKRLPWYNLSCLGAFFIKMFFLLTVEMIFSLSPACCNVIALVFSGIFNYFMGDRVVFR